MSDANNNGDDNFNLSNYVTKVDEAHDILSQPHLFSDKFCRALDSQIDMRKGISKILLEVLRADTEFQEELKRTIMEVESDLWKTWVRRFGLAAWSAIVFVLGVMATVLITKLIN